MPGIAAGTDALRQRTVASATSSTSACWAQLLPETTMLALRMVPSSMTLCSYSEPNNERSVASVTSKHSSMSCAPSINTSGSTIGTMPAS